MFHKHKTFVMCILLSTKIYVDQPTNQPTDRQGDPNIPVSNFVWTSIRNNPGYTPRVRAGWGSIVVWTSIRNNPGYIPRVRAGWGSIVLWQRLFWPCPPDPPEDTRGQQTASPADEPPPPAPCSPGRYPRLSGIISNIYIRLLFPDGKYDG